MKKTLILFFLLGICAITTPRNPRRPIDKTIPSICIQASDSNKAKSWISANVNSKTSLKPVHSLKTPFLRLNTIKQSFDQTFFEQHYLPNKSDITFRDKTGSINSKILSQLADKLIAEIKARKRSFVHFKILKDRDFNYKTLSGLLVLKYKDYPFVIKLSIEHPHTMAQPYSKSFEAKFIFICGGNIRHLSNFTRISNLEKIKQILSYNSYYLENIDFPRKWYWQPTENYNLHITWNKTPYCDAQKFIIPSIYAVISDYINIDPTYPQSELNKIAMKVATDVNFRIDPHAGNFVVEKESTKYTTLDTENLKLMIGIDNTMYARKYISWFFELSINCLHIYAGRTKDQRIAQSFTYNIITP